MEKFKRVRNSYFQNDFLKPLVIFFTKSWKLIAFSGILIFSLVFFYVLNVPVQFEASARIKMAKIVHDEYTLKGDDVESVSLLISRMKTLDTSSIDFYEGCDLKNERFKSLLGDTIKFNRVKEDVSLVEIKVLRNTKESATKCVQAIFESIKKAQSEMLEPYLDEVRARIVSRQKLIKQITNNVKLIEGSSTSLTITYLSQFEDMRVLYKDIVRLGTIIESSKINTTKLVGSIQSSEYSKYPKRVLTIIWIAILGASFGFLIAVVLYVNYQTKKACESA